MAVRTGRAEWTGSVQDGGGTMETGSGVLTDAKFGVGTRMGEDPGTNPEELIGAAHAGCFSMQLSALLGNEGHPPESLRTEAKVQFLRQDDGFAITRIELTTRGVVPGIDDAEFQRIAAQAKDVCPVSKALAAVPEITLDAALES
jgi:osmotically inducible protein OsmC